MQSKKRNSRGAIGLITFVLLATTSCISLVFAAPSNGNNNSSARSTPKARAYQHIQKAIPPVSSFPDLSLEPILADEPVPPVGFPALPSSIELPFDSMQAMTRTNVEPPAIIRPNFQESVDKAKSNMVAAARNSLKQAPTADAHLTIGRILADPSYAGRDVRQAYYHLRKAVELNAQSDKKLLTTELAEAHKILGEMLKDAAYQAHDRGELHTFGMRLKNSYIEFRRAVELNPERADLKGNLLEVTQQAVGMLSSYNNYLALGHAYYLVGNNSLALGAYQTCKYYEPDSSELAKAIQRIDTKYAVSLRKTVDLNNDGVVMLKRKEFRSAISKFELALKIDPRYALAKSNLVAAYNNFAIELVKQKKQMEAVQLLQQAVIVSPDDKLASNNLQALINDEKTKTLKKEGDQSKLNATIPASPSADKAKPAGASSSSEQRLEQVHKALAQLETKTFSKTFESDDVVTRLSRLEQKLLGKEQEGTLMKRIDGLLILH